MGSCTSNFSKRKKEKKAKKDMRILMVGMDAAGKTTILYKLKLGETIITFPTCAHNVEKLKYNNLRFEVWDVGGQDKIRPHWPKFYRYAEGLIFVVDCFDRDRVWEAQEALKNMLTADELRDLSLLVFANKQDLPNAMTTEELTEELGLRRVRDRKWHIQASSAISGDGLYEGLDWLSTQHKNEK